MGEDLHFSSIFTNILSSNRNESSWKCYFWKPAWRCSHEWSLPVRVMPPITMEMCVRKREVDSRLVAVNLFMNSFIKSSHFHRFVSGRLILLQGNYCNITATMERLFLNHPRQEKGLLYLSISLSYTHTLTEYSKSESCNISCSPGASPSPRQISLSINLWIKAT